MVSVIPSAVIGLTKDDAPSLAVVPSGRTRHAEASTARYCEYIAPPAIATVFPMRAWAAGDDPAATTVPAPSLPTGSDLSSRADSAPRAASSIEAVTTGRSGVPATVAVVMSALAMRRPKSDGLIGEASTRTNTSLAPGVWNWNLVQREFERATRASPTNAALGLARQISGHGWCLVPVVGLPSRVSTLEAATDLPSPGRGKTIGRRGARSGCAHAGCRRGPRTRTGP